MQEVLLPRGKNPHKFIFFLIIEEYIQFFKFNRPFMYFLPYLELYFISKSFKEYIVLGRTVLDFIPMVKVFEGYSL